MQSLADPVLLETATQRIGSLTESTPALWGVMCAQEMVLHLTDSMAAASSGVPLRRLPSSRGGSLGRLFALHTPLRWPRNVPTVPELDRRGKPRPDPLRFAEDRAGLEQALRRFVSLSASQLSPEHPYFGAVSREEWMIWAWRHADHHLRQFGC